MIHGSLKCGRSYRRPMAVVVAALWLIVGSSAGCSRLRLAIDRLPPLPTPANLRKAEEQRYSLARLSERKGSYAEARHIYQKIIDKNPKSQRAWQRLAVVASSESKWDEAERCYRKAREIGPVTADLLSDMGYTLYLQHRLPEAESLLREALVQEPQHRPATNNLALVLGQLGRFDESYACFRRVNSEAEAEANFAYVLAQTGNYGLAQNHYSRALNADENMRSAATALLELAQREGRGRPVPGARLDLNRFAVPNAPGMPPQQAPYNAAAGAPNPNLATPQIQPVLTGPPQPVALTSGTPYAPPTTASAMAAYGSQPPPAPQQGGMAIGVISPPQPVVLPAGGSAPAYQGAPGAVQASAWSAPPPNAAAAPIYPQASPTVQPYTAAPRN